MVVLVARTFAQGVPPEVVINPGYDFQRTNILPTSIESVGFKNTDKILSQDLLPTDSTPSFNEYNSASLEVTRVVIAPADTTDTGASGEQPSPDTPTTEMPSGDVSIPAEEVTPAEPAAESAAEPFSFVTGLFDLVVDVFDSPENTPAPEVVSDPVVTPEPVTEQVEEVMAPEEVTPTPDMPPQEPPLEVTPTPDAESETQDGVPVEETPQVEGETALPPAPVPTQLSGIVEQVCDDSCTTHSIQFADFSVGDLFEGQEITNALLKLSLATEATFTANTAEQLTIEYFFDNEWRVADPIMLAGADDNAGRGGYLSYQLPLFDWGGDVEKFVLKISYDRTSDRPATVLVDSVWLELESIDEEAFRADPNALSPQELEFTVEPPLPEGMNIELMSAKTDFATDEQPFLAYKAEKVPTSFFGKVTRSIGAFFGRKQPAFTMEIVGGELADVAEVKPGDDGLIVVEIPKQREFKPGEYEIELAVTNGSETYFITQDFTWGVLSLNVDKSIYQPGETAYLQMGVLDEGGHTICNAALTARIKKPNGEERVLSTRTGELKYGEECAGDTYTTSPDYYGYFNELQEVGTYRVQLTASTKNGSYTIADSFEVREQVPFVIARTGPTRIYPFEPYDFAISVTATEDFVGTIEEQVPLSFQVEIQNDDASTTARIYDTENERRLAWDVSMLAGETRTFRYRFDAPNKSPEFYLLGPVTINDFAEIRQWQIASDAPVPVVASWTVNDTQAGDTANITLTAPTGIQNGDLLVAVVTKDDNLGVFTAPAGFLPLHATIGTTIDYQAWYKIASSEAGNYVFSSTDNDNFIGAMLRITGVSTSTPINATGTANNTNQFPTAPSVTTTVPDALVLRLFGADDQDVTDDTNYPGSHTGLFVRASNAGAGSVSLGAAHATQTSPGTTGAASFTLNVNNEEWAATTVAISPPRYLTVGSTGNQTSQVALNTANNYLGGAFTFSVNFGTTSITSIAVNEAGTINAQNDLSNIKLFYEFDTSAPYNCASESYNGTELQYGSTSASFSAANGTSTFTGNVTVSTTSVMCAYVVADVDSTASVGNTIELQISNPSLAVSAPGSRIDPSVAVAISSTTDVIIGFPPTTPTFTNTPMFENMKSTTTQPTFGGFVSTDPESSAIQYEFSIDDNYDFSSPATTTNSVNFPTDAGWSAATFSSGATTTYRIQQALTPGTTYFYRVRARDPSNSNTWSSYSEIRSVTISDSITVPQWFETLEEQFIQGSTFSNATTSGLDSVEIASTTARVSLLDGFTTGNTKTISSGQDRLLIVAIVSEDSGTDVNVSSVTYGGSLLTTINNQTIGTGFSNGMWVGYLNEAGIASSSGNTITPTWTGSGTPTPNNGIAYVAAVFSNVDQSNPIRSFSNNALTTGTNITPAGNVSVLDGDYAFYVSETQQGLTHTPSTGYTEGTEQDLGTDDFTVASAYKQITEDGNEFPTATWSGSGNRLLMLAASIKASPANGTIRSSEIDFDWVSNQTDWGEVTWEATEPPGSITRMQVMYSSSTACDTVVPNSALPGNSTGFATTSMPINISTLSTSTYNRICLRATLSEGTGTTSPTLNSWTVSWERSPVFDQSAYRWYVNTNAITPTDTWPQGATANELAENQPINEGDPVNYGTALRLRTGLTVSSVSASGYIFKLQYAAGEVCGPDLTWTDVADSASTTALWRGFNNAAVADGATLPSGLLASTDTLETYEEENPSASFPNSIAVGNQGEWDWVIQHRAEPGTSYCFRMVRSDGSPISTYTQYPQLVTNRAPVVIETPVPFDNERLASTSPWFEFKATDEEGNTVDYQIQIDNDVDFSSTIINTNSITNLINFENRDTPADKSPFNQNETIRYTIPSALTNNTTYWWRVRSIDATGSNTYGEWSTAQSFTVNTATAIATWFQTTEEQFETDTLVGVEATAADLVSFIAGSTTGTTTSTAIDFDSARTGNAWGSFSFTDTGAAGNILYRIEYNNNGTWELIPDADLAGNSAGYDTSPVSLINLDTETYNQIRIRANFNSGTPTLTDWTVEWGVRVAVPTHLLRFDNEKVATVTPTFTFFTTDPEGDDLVYEFSWSTDNTFTTGTSTVISSSSPGFANLSNGGDTSPFASGNTISYTMQTPLTGSTTYWWRVRGIDPADNSFSFWSEPWSFTVATSATTSTWFQTTQEQFETDTLVGLVASTSDSVSTIPAGEAVYNFVGVTNPSTGNIARDFEVDVLDPTDPPNNNDVDTITTNGTTAGTPNLRTAIAGYASDAEATTAQYGLIATSDNTRWQITDPGAGDNAVFWASFDINEDPSIIDEIEVNLEGYQAAAVDKAWLAIWRPGSTTPHWQRLADSTQTTDFNYTGTITTNISQYLDGNNRIHIMFFNEDDSDSLFVDYVEVRITTGTAESGTLTGTPIDFDDGSGPAWGQFYWTDTTPGASDIRYQLEYLNGTTWTLIPDSALSGNSTGFTNAPVNLSALNTATYNEIRPVANFTCNLANCPTLSDWTVEWSRGFTISGTAFEYDGVSSTTSGTVAVAVDGVLQLGKTGTIVNGNWSIENVTFFAGDVITVFVEGAADDSEAVAVTRYDGTPDVGGMRLQKRHLTIGSNDFTTASNTDLALYDFTNDEDLFFDVNAGNDLTMCATTGCGDAGLRILVNNTYSPGTGADVTTHDYINAGTFTAGANTVRVNGSWTNTGTSTLTGSTVIFTATSTTESINNTGAVLGTFNNLTLGETSGSATWNLSSALDVDGNLSVTHGTLARGAQTITIAGNLTVGASGFFTGIATTTFDGINPSTWTDQNATKQNPGYVVVDGQSKTLQLGSNATATSMTIGANDTFSLANFAVTILQNWTNQNTFTPGTGTVYFAATTTGRTITPGTSAFYNLTFNGVGGGWSFATSVVSITNDVTFATGTVTLPTGTTTVGGSWVSTGGVFAHNNGTVAFTATTPEVITFNGGAFTNTLFTMNFQGSGSWTITDTNATSSNDVILGAGTVTMPSGVFAIGGSLLRSGGALSANNGTIAFYSTSPESIQVGASSLHNVRILGSSTFTMTDTNVTQLGTLTVAAGTIVLPSGTFTLGGSIQNTATITPNNGTVLLNSTDTGETIALGASSLYNLTFNSATGGWTITQSATTTNNTTLTAGTFTLSSGQTLSVGGTFQNAMNSASTTWTGSTLSLENGAYTINTKTSQGDTYGTLRVAAPADIAMWNSSATSYAVNAAGSLYSQDHAAADGDLYIFGAYTRTTGTERWSYATDFDGTSLGTSSRAVDVRFASGASATFTTATVEILGTTTASTTIANQGSGTYTVTLNQSTINARNYEFTNLDSAGLSLLASTTVTSLRDGAFVPTVGGGSGITVSSSTIDTNPALQIFNVRFATTSAISAFNVSQTGGAPTSYWWFRTGTGNLYGEAFDNDTGDPGSIRFDDSSLVISISGTVYTDAGVTPLVGGTCDGVTNVVRVAVEGGSTYSAPCSNVNGTFTVPGVVVVGDPTIAVYLNDASGGQEAVTLTKTPTANITGLDLYQNRLILRHEDVISMTLDDIAVFDDSFDDDLFYTAATGTTPNLTVYGNRALYIWTDKDFTPEGAVTLYANATANTYDGSLYLAASSTMTMTGTSTLTIGGSLDQGSNAQFIAASSTVLMNATTTGKTVNAAANQTINFNELTFSGVGGGWNLNGDISIVDDLTVATGTLTGTEDIAIAYGSFTGNGVVSLGGGTTTIARSNTLGGTQPWTFRSLTLGNGSVVGTTTPAGTATTTISGVLTIALGHFLDANNARFNLSGTGTVFVENGTFLEDTSTVRYSGTGATNITATNYSTLILDAAAGTPTYTALGPGIQVFDDVLVGLTGNTTVTFDANDPALNIDGDLIIGSTGTFIASNSGSFTLAGSYDNNGTFTSSNGTLTLDGPGARTIAAGNSSFANVTVNASGTITMSEHATATNQFTLNNATGFTVASGQTLAVGGSFTTILDGSLTTYTGSTLSLYGGGNYSINSIITSDTYDTLSIGANTQVRLWNSSATTVLTATGGSVYSQDHGNVNGQLNIYGDYVKTSGIDHWSYGTDFDGTGLSGSERAVTVNIESGATTYWTGGGLSVIGTTTASTTVQNQGSGTYSLMVGGTASTTWQYVVLRDTNSSGLTLTGAPSVGTWRNVDFLAEANGATTMTVGGSVITANPAKNFPNMIFNAAGGVSGASNVTATGTTLSAWRFTAHTGDLDGESFDVDPGGDPGYLIWDDSASIITISGRVYQNDRTTRSTVCDGTTRNILLAIDGSLLQNASSTCSAVDGSYSISGVSFSANDVLTLFINDETENGVTVSVNPVSSISDMDIYENHVILRHENTDPLTIAQMAIYDSSDDADIIFTAVDGATDTLTVPANNQVVIWNNKEFEPNGNVTLSGGGGGASYDGTLELFGSAIFTGASGQSHSIGGSLLSAAGATVAMNTASTTFTSSAAARTVDSNNATFGNVVFNGSGSWTIADTSFTTDDLTFTQGSVTLPSATTTITGSLAASSGTFNSNSGIMLFTSSSTETINQGTSNFAEVLINGSGTFTFTSVNATATESFTKRAGTLTLPSGTISVGGSFQNLGGTLAHNTSELVLATSSAAVLTASSSDLFAVRFTGGGTFTMTDNSVSVLDDFIITAGSVALATGTLSVGGSWDTTGGSFSSASGTVLFNSTDTGETINPGASAFYNVSIAGPTGGFTVTGNATATNNFALTAASVFTQNAGTILTVGGVFTNGVGGASTTWANSILKLTSGTDYNLNTKTAGGDQYGTLSIDPLMNIEAWNSSAATTTLVSSSTSSFYSKDHAGVDGNLYIYGQYNHATGTLYWNYENDFDGTLLTGGSRRAVNVYLVTAASSSMTLSAATLELIGAAGATTTVQAIGTGNYAFAITGGTFNAQYYAFRNLNADGLNISGTPIITSLNNGDLELSVTSGSLITVTSAALTANASKIFNNIRFATTSGVSGTNVELTGSTISSWRFQNTYGQIDGEAFDIDGIDACGSVRWDDSACLLLEQTEYRWRHDDGGVGVPDSEWYSTSWSKRKSVRIDNADASAYNNAAVKLTVAYDSDMQADFDDLRFTSSNGTTLISHFIASTTNSTMAEVWVEVPTIPANDTATVYMYYGNATASSTSSSTATFVAADDFEDGSLSEYSGDTTLFTIDGTFAYGGTRGLDNTGDENQKATDGIARFDQTVSQGQTIRYQQYINTGTGDEVCTLFAVQSPVTANQNYAVCLEQFGTSRMSIVRNAENTDSTGTLLASTTVTYTDDMWYTVEVDWGTDDVIFVSLYDSAGAIVATTTATDGTYTSGGIGFTYWFNYGGWDNYTSRPMLTTEPTTRFGAEQVSGGANWSAAQNTKAVYDSNDIARLRIAIENSGTNVTSQNFDIEFAPKGAAPSCEAVDGANYQLVPNQASCGTSALCTQTTTFYTNGAATGDLLSGTAGDFVAGQAIESPSNTTSDLDINQDFFTEIEYALTPTVNATSTNYCLRVTNSGAELDSYLNVAELELTFAPQITALSLNGGINIVPIPGATTTVFATGTVSDLNGYTNLSAATATIYRSGVGETCSPNDNNCYRTACSFMNCGGNQCTLSCPVDIVYHAEPTDAGTYAGETWRAFALVSDNTNATTSSFAPSIDLQTVNALTLLGSSTISYGTLEVGTSTEGYNATTTVENIGNGNIDVSLEGTDLTDGGASTIAASQQRFATTTFSYSSCVFCTALSNVPSQLEIDLFKPTSTSSPVFADIYWGIAIPFGTAAAAHQGLNTFYAVTE